MTSLRKYFFIILFFISHTLVVNAIQSVLPIVFHKNYDISFWGIENMHPFDTKKYGKIAKHLEKTCNISYKDFQKPEKITDEQLRAIHTKEYLLNLKRSSTVATIAEVFLLSYLPNFLLQRNMLDNMRYATAGTILGAQLALEQGWAINLGGGYHHAKSNNGEGFCFFADIPLAVNKLRQTNPDLKVLIVDLDAHQGNGLESILGPDPLTFIFDMYSANNYPQDFKVFKYIDFNYPLADYIQDDDYLNILEIELPKAIKAVKPDLIIYNAGSDIFQKDPLGKMTVSKEGIINRDAFLFDQAFKNKIPILMVLSGGYSAESASIVGESIENILKQFNLIDMNANEDLVKSLKPWKKIK